MDKPIPDQQPCCRGSKSGHDENCWRKQFEAIQEGTKAGAVARALEGLLDKMEHVNGSVGFYVSELTIREALAKVKPDAR